MTRPTRYLALGALAYPVLNVVAFLAFPQPGGDASPAADSTWLTAHVDLVIAQCFVRATAALGFVIMAVALTQWCHGMAGRMVTAAGTASGLVLLLAQAPVLTAALGVGDGLSADVLRFADRTNSALLDLASVPAIVMFAAAAAGLWREQSAPRWLVWATIAGVPVAALDALSYQGGPLAAVGLPGLAYFLVWSLVTSGWMLASPHTTNRPSLSRVGNIGA